MVINGKKHDGPIRRRKSGMDKPIGRIGRAEVVINRTGKTEPDQGSGVQADESDSVKDTLSEKA